jgi:AcrR family transcriptional regulator
MNNHIQALETLTAVEHSATRERILAAARFLFAEQGMHRVTTRDICARAEANTAATTYYFQSKENLYQAVIRDAGCRLTALADESPNWLQNTDGEARIARFVALLMRKLGEDRAWMAKLVVREVVDSRSGWATPLGLGLRRCVLAAEALIKLVSGDQDDQGSVQLRALTLVVQCVFFSILDEDVSRVWPQGNAAADRESLINHVVWYTLPGGSQSGPLKSHPTVSDRSSGKASNEESPGLSVHYTSHDARNSSGR